MLSAPTKASLFPIILWRCWAGSEHGITQPRPHDLRWVVRRAAGPKPSPQQAEHCFEQRRGLACRTLGPDLDSRMGFRQREWQKCWRLIKPGQKCGAKLKW